MKLIFIYGPPAVGKLTVAKELARLTGYKLFHNHLLTDIVSKFFKIGSKPFLDLLYKIRLNVLEAAAKNKFKGHIATTLYAPSANSNKFIKNTIKKIKLYGGKIYFVRLYCSRRELFKRVRKHDRKQFGKINESKELTKVLKKWALFEKIPFVKSFSIDNTNVSAKEVAKGIKLHHKL